MSLLGELTYALIQPSSRAVGTVIPDVVVREVHRDELIITQHPVEKGATITDHAFKRPSECEMFCGFSNSAAGYEGYTRDVYQRLLALQNTRRPFTAYTGKRAYRNMLIRGLSVETDPSSENTLMVVVGLQEIILVSTQTTGTGTATAGAGDNQASPATTGTTTNIGDQSTVAVSDTAFAGAFNPGQFDTTGNGLDSPGVGSGVGLGTGDAPALTGDVPALDGITPPLQIVLPEQSVMAITPESQISMPPYFDVFGATP